MSEETIFALALEQPDPAARSAFLAEACGSDAALRQRVEALLRTHEQLGDFLERPAVERVAGSPDRPDATGDFTPDEEPGTMPAHTMAEGAAADDAGDSARPADEPGVTVGLLREGDSELTGGHRSDGAPHARDEDTLAFLAPAQEAVSLGRLDHFEVQEVVGRGGMAWS